MYVVGQTAATPAQAAGLLEKIAKATGGSGRHREAQSSGLLEMAICTGGFQHRSLSLSLSLSLRSVQHHSLSFGDCGDVLMSNFLVEQVSRCRVESVPLRSQSDCSVISVPRNSTQHPHWCKEKSSSFPHKVLVFCWHLLSLYHQTLPGCNLDHSVIIFLSWWPSPACQGHIALSSHNSGGCAF